MARDSYMAPQLGTGTVSAVRFGAGNAEANRWDGKEVGKLVKLVGESRWDLTAAGNDIEGQVYAVELAPQNGYTVGGVTRFQSGDLMTVVFDGLQAAPGDAATLAIGDIVVSGTATAKGTALTTYPKVCKATTAANVVFKWRVVSLGTAGTGAVGTQGVIERI